MISHAIQNAFRKGRARGWDHVYFAFDIHDTILKANYSNTELPTEIYDTARPVLEYISGREDIIMIIYTCSHKHELKQYQEYFDNLGIKFKFANENPMVLTNNHGYGNYDKKMYFDVLLEDKAGFIPETDWPLVMKTLLQEPLLTNKHGN